MNRTVIITLAVLVLLFIAGGLLFRTQKQTVPNTNSAPSTAIIPASPSATGISQEGSESAKITESPTSTSAKEIVVVGSNFKFEPSQIQVSKGSKVKITFKNASGTHDFRIDELGIATSVIQTGQEESVEFTADKTGSFEYYCSVANHRAMGMHGTLIVK